MANSGGLHGATHCRTPLNITQFNILIEHNLDKEKNTQRYISIFIKLLYQLDKVRSHKFKFG